MKSACDIKVSIIVPVYNVARWLRRCLESCVNQTMPEIEIIVVNDCSPDPVDSVIMREFEAKYPDKVKCLWHSENKKPGGARNTGIRVAKGEYLNFIDSDDYIDSRMCEKLYGKARENDADYIYCDYYMVDNSMRYRERYTERDEYCERNLLCDAWIWGYMVKRKTFFGNHLSFIEKSPYGEDVAMCFLCLLLFKKSNKLPEALYYYCMTPSSLMQSSTKQLRSPFYYDAFAQMRRQYKKIFSDSDLLVFDMKSLVWLATYLYFFPENMCKHHFNSLKKYAHDENIDVSAVVASIRNGCIREKLGLLWAAIHEPFTEEQIKRKLLDFDVMRAENALKEFKGIVVWGSGVRGRRLCSTLREAGISFEVTDMNTACCGMKDLNVRSWDALKDRADVVIATPVLGFDGIRAQVGNELPVIDMEEIQA